MGFLEKLFGGGSKYPTLTNESPATKKLAAVKGSLEELSRKVSDPMEVVPADDSAYVFIGNPPKNFGMAWIEDGRVHSFKTLSEEKGVAQKQLLKLVDDLAEAYRRSGEDSRYSTTIGGRVVTVIPSEELASRVQNIIANS